ncbi:MAG: murein biosynthesis integral membrane protein MurJ [Candidatus Andersenbacteria bacterium]|nr:murein biosynthesis integral membrane protein MurJ [Candidatus Andersenbacteria bacterium]MBI3250275.1 murein biosynthesis integral membrane protein MurJ [Candidatus Andersenbacteria bacterium]
MKTEFERTTGNAGVIGLTAFGGALVGFVLQLLVAYYFGAAAETDAFFMAQSTSELLSKLLLGGSITAVFIPMFVQKLSNGRRQDAWHMALNIFHITAVLYIMMIAILTLFARPFIHFIAPGFAPETFELTVYLLYILLPSFLFLFLVEFATSMLHSLQRFALPASMRLLAPAISIIAIVTLAPRMGIAALAIGVAIGSLFQFLVLMIGLRRAGLKYRFIFNIRDPIVRQLAYMVYPFIFSVLVTQVAGIVYRMLVSDLTEGSLASLKFAEKITQLLTIMFLNSVTLVIFPLLSQKASKKDAAGMLVTISSAIRLITFVTVPLVIGVALLREPLIDFVYQHGSFSKQDAAMTSIALLFLVLGLTTNGISSVFGHAVLALQKTKAAVIVSIASQIVAISLFLLLVPPMGHAGLALASSLVPISTALLYGFYLRRHIPNLTRAFHHITFLKTACLAILLAAVILFIRTVELPGISLTQLFLPTLIGCVVFFGGAWLWKVEEMETVLAIIRGKLVKWRKV